MNGERESYTERILNAIEYGRLSMDETERRLNALIEAEVNKTDSAADMDLIEACQTLLWQLYTHGTISYNSHYTENKVMIAKKLNRSIRHANTVKITGKILAAAAAVVMVILGLNGSLHWEWLERNNTLDQQQHIIVGNEAGVELIQTAIAEYSELETIRVLTSQEFTKHIGFVPMPSFINETWFFSFADISATPDFMRIDAQYENNKEQTKLLYTTLLFTDAREAYATFEQSANGDYRLVENNRVYITDNVYRKTMCWTDGLVFVRLSGELTEEDGLSIAQKLLKEWHKQ